MNAEFDNYSRDYEALLKDPIRDRFTSDSGFFHLCKWLLLEEFLRRRGWDTKNRRWLDVGCGKGELLRLGERNFAEALGCDPSVEMLRECAGLHVSHQTCNTELPFDDATMDVVTAACVYHHLSPAERGKVTSEARRLLKPGGLFAVFEHNPWNPATRLIVSRTPVDANAVLLTAREVRRWMKQAGLSAVRSAYYLYLPEPLFSRFGRLEHYLGNIPFGGQYAVFGFRNGQSVHGVAFAGPARGKIPRK